MNKEVKQLNKEGTQVRVSMADERWYIKATKDGDWIPSFIAVPSVTWICSYYYTSPYLVKWIAEKGLSESERIRDEAAFKGSRVHRAVELWLDDVEIKIDTKIECEGENKALTPEENECFKSFIDFYKEVKPEVLSKEYVVWGDGYAGSVDIKCKIDGVLGILDIKTSQAIHKPHELQLSAYKHADKENPEKMWILQLGYRKNKARWKLTEVDDKYKLFLNAKETWAEENEGATPKYIEYPTTYPTKKEVDGVKTKTK